MTIRVAIHHHTSYQYERPVSLSPQLIRLRPAPHCRTPVVRFALDVVPKKHFLNWQQDPFGNFLARLVFPERVSEFRVEVDLLADLTVINPFDFFIDASAESFPFAYDPILSRDLRPYLETEPAGPRLQALLASHAGSKGNTVDFLVALNAQLQRSIRYIIRLEPGVQTCEETLEKGCGSCRDTAWLLVQLLRHLGLAARFVSGYLVQLVPDVKALDGPVGASRDFTDLHAWTEVYLPGAGWVGLDPTSGLFAGEGHIPLACTPHYSSAAPIEGGVEPCQTKFDFAMSVARYHEDPRVTKPYTEEQWQRILTQGRHVDARLSKGDVRLTMGGEPTFVSIDDMDGAEWTVAAVGPMKRRHAANLLRRLQARFAPGGLLHYGQGKWYPGESLPRWALSCLWRTDGQPLWHDLSLLADEHQEDHGAEDAQRFLETLADRLGVERQWILPAYEDIWHYLEKERKLPVNVPPGDHRIEDAEERARLALVFEQRGLSAVAGYVLPLQRQEWQSQARWVSGPWTFRSPALFLLPGDSPIGFRLPIEALPWEAQRAAVIQVDPTAPRQPLPPQSQRRYTAHASDAPQPTTSQVVRTAMCIEPRQGRLHVFMPPVASLEDYLDLLAGIEEAAASLRMPIVLEGYLPPPDYRLNVIKVTPDPGVIEVNIHPSTSWDECVDITTTLYEEARLARLGTEKFGLDGRHTGTGGGNHVVLGGATPGDSPFLRRPDLLRSLLVYWNNHPSLSYLFSGLFVGPTSQAPRVDEGRRDALYELAIACDQVPEPGTTPIMPWLVDRLFRHLLADLTGNTHRAEFCIDKLYAPETANGRLGLVEFRAFEMPPHARMSLTQQLLLRALVARFWESPYREPLVHWGTRLHDQFLLPWFLWRDFAAVVREVNETGFGLELDWFAPHLEFRCPLIGQVSYDGVTLELRGAIEPWYVLGEEPGATATARYVDSSLERLQIRATNLTEGRHVVTCNGRKVPLHPTGVAGEYVAGVRYRAWQPAHCLHPTIPVHTPLVFDIVDAWQRRTLGGCTYHVAHPGGRNYTTFPVNAYEAESRRAARFFTTGHTGGVLPQLTDDRSEDYPLTLDLRRS